MHPIFDFIGWHVFLIHRNIMIGDDTLNPIVGTRALPLVDFVNHSKTAMCNPGIELTLDNILFARKAYVVDTHQWCEYLLSKCSLPDALHFANEEQSIGHADGRTREQRGTPSHHFNPITFFRNEHLKEIEPWLRIVLSSLLNRLDWWLAIGIKELAEMVCPIASGRRSRKIVHDSGLI